VEKSAIGMFLATEEVANLEFGCETRRDAVERAKATE
jgi:hypothetical protein